MTGSVAIDDFREAAKEPVTVSLRLLIQVRASDVWMGLFRLDGSSHPGGTQLASRRLVRPGGKTDAECVEAALGLAYRSQQSGGLIA